MPRSGKQQRFYWALLRAVLHQQEYYATVEALHEVIKLRLGMVERIELHNGDIHLRVLSSSYDDMDGGDFNRHVDRTLDLVCTEIIPGLDAAGRRALTAEVERMLGPL